MYELRIFQKSEGLGRGEGMTSKCRSCGAEIIWIKTFSGKKMPVDAAIVNFFLDPKGKELFVMENGAVVHGIKALPGEVHYYPGEVHYYPGHISHFATCPNADQHRRRRK